MILHPINTEKTMRALQENNTLVFAVEKKDRKAHVKKMVEEQFQVKVVGVRTVTNLQGKKRAFVTLAADSPAVDVATKLGLM